MREGYYGKEPFDLRLILLRLIKNLPGILVITLIGTLLFGGGYYVKNVLLDREEQYSATSTYKVEYVREPAQSGDYFINEMSWNTYVQSYEFVTAVQEHLGDAGEMAVGTEGVAVTTEGASVTAEELSLMITAKLPSDWHVPTTTVTAKSPEEALLIAGAVEQAMVEDFTGIATELKTVSVLSPALTAELVEEDVRPVRAIILSAILSCFFAGTIYLIWELSVDSIWLPVTLYRRYGLPVVGTIHSKELSANLEYRFKGMEKVAVCTVAEDMNPVEVAEALKEKLSGTAGKQEGAKMPETAKAPEGVFTPVPAPLLCEETAEILRNMDGILLVVKAGSHSGKPLEYVLEYFVQQDIKITAALLWEADEQLIRAYYLLPGGIRE